MVYAIGDVHGARDALEQAEALISRDAETFGRSPLIIMLGDYVDRGRHSSGVLERLSGHSESGIPRICLCGNHDELMSKFIVDPLYYREWLKIGGDRTLNSYGLDFEYIFKRHRRQPERIAETLRDTIPPEHVRFLNDLPVLAYGPSHVFVHAGVRPAIPLEKQSDRDLMWIRQPFLADGPRLPLTVIHGHSPDMNTQLYKGRIGIDTGAYATGRLTILRIVDDTYDLSWTR